MKLVVVGASGACGKHLVLQGLEKKHEIVAVCRDSSKYAPGRTSMEYCEGKDGVTIKRGKVDDLAFLTECLKGSDVLLSAIGVKLSGISPWASVEDPTLLTRAGPVLAQAAADAGTIKRVLAITAAGVAESWDMMPMAFKGFCKMSALRKAYNELEPFEKALFAGTVETCCVRPTGLTNDEAGALGPTVVATALSGRTQIPRADVAKWMLEHLEGDIGRAPVITVTGATATED